MFAFILQYHYIRINQTQIFSKSEKENDAKVIDRILESKAAGFLKPTKDNSAWDEMYEFTKNKDTAWAHENLEGVLITFSFSYMGAFDTKGHALYTVSDSTTKDFIITSLNINNWFFNKKIIYGFTIFNNNLFEIFGTPIVPSYDIYYKTKSNGFLISAKKWDNSYIHEIETTTGFKAEISTSTKIDSLSSDNNYETIYKQLKSISGETIATLKFYRERTYTTQINYLNLLAISSLIMLIISLVIFFLLVNRWINKPMKNITKSLKTGEDKYIESLKNKKTEFGEIARLINKFNEQKEHLVKEVKKRTEANEKFEALLKAQPDIIFIINNKGYFSEYYSSTDNYLFKNKEDIIGKALYEVYPENFSKLLLSKLDEIINNKTIYSFEYELPSEKGILNFEARLVAIDDTNILSVVRDITDLKKVETELVIARNKAQESDRLKSAFLANMSHEIRTPMHAILGFSKLLEDRSISNEEKSGFINIINKSGEELLTLINDIIDISKIESNLLELSRSSFNLNNLMEQLLIKFESEKIRLNKKEVVLKLEKFFENRFANIICDNVRLAQVLNNLIGNALKFTDKGHIRFGYRVDGDFLLFFVEDTGKGISKCNHDLIFERFRQEDESNERNFGGAGLGLSICKGIVELMGGKIWMESIEGNGSTFYFTLPASILVKSEENEVTMVQEKDFYDFTGKTIIIAEDIIENFELIKILLRKTNANLIHAENGADAIQKFKSAEKTDLILMDIRMPVMNGYDATKELKKINPNLPIIALTAHAFSEEKTKCLNAGCDDFISKPIDEKSLLLIIEKFLKTRS